MWSEKFSDLYHIAWVQAEFTDYYKTKPTYERRNVVALEIFAEDIVRECADLFKNVYITLEGEKSLNIEIAHKQVLRHFGVEE